MSVTVAFSGGKALEQALADLDMSTAKKRTVARRALDRAAEPIQQAWQQGVDKDERDLERSIKIGGRASTKASRRFARGAGAAIVERYVGIDATEDSDGRLAVYSYIEEFGDEKRPANPAGRQAFESQKQAALDRLADDLWAEIERAAKAAARKTARLAKRGATLDANAEILLSGLK